jgi:hypothetical protein
MMPSNISGASDVSCKKKKSTASPECTQTDALIFAPTTLMISQSLDLRQCSKIKIVTVIAINTWHMDHQLCWSFVFQ